jgi:hypothetical protein
MEFGGIGITTIDSRSPRPETPAEKEADDKVPVREWRSEALRWPCLVLFALFDLSIMVTLIALVARSLRDSGFVTIPDQQMANGTEQDDGDERGIGLPNISLDLGILWTFLPSAVLQLLNIYWQWIAGSLASRQPYVDLLDGRAAAAASSVLLDYGCTPSLWRWWRAFRLGHATVGLTALTGLALQYISAPLGARLFATRVIMMPADIPISFNSAYIFSAFSDKFDMRPALSSARLALVNNENRHPWTNDEFAFRPFHSPLAPRTGEYRLVANTTAYSAYVNCELVSDYTMSLELVEPGKGVVQVKGTDRGCDFSHGVAVVEGPPDLIFFKTSAQHACSHAAHYSRLIFTAGTYSPTSPYLLSNVSVISCATDYRTIAGLLEVAVSWPPSSPTSGAPGPPTTVFHSFTPLMDNNSSSRHDTPWMVMETRMLEIDVFNPGIQWLSSEFGNNILYVAEKQAGRENLLSPQVLMQAIARVFGATYAATTAMVMFTPLEVAETSVGTMWTPTTRLFVVEWAAYAVLALLLVALFLSGWVFWRVQSTRSILTEEPEGLLAMAGLLDGSDLMTLVPRIRQQSGYDGRVRHTGKSLPEVKDTPWVASADGTKLTGEWTIKRKTD